MDEVLYQMKDILKKIYYFRRNFGNSIQRRGRLEMRLKRSLVIYLVIIILFLLNSRYYNNIFVKVSFSFLQTKNMIMDAVIKIFFHFKYTYICIYIHAYYKMKFTYIENVNC